MDGEPLEVDVQTDSVGTERAPAAAAGELEDETMDDTAVSMVKTRT